MPITGLSFLLFALAAVVLYYLFPKRQKRANERGAFSGHLRASGAVACAELRIAGAFEVRRFSGFLRQCSAWYGAAAAAFSSAARHILLHFPNLRLSDRYQPR